MKKWGRAGHPKSQKRKNLLKRARKSINRKYKGYGSKKSFKADRRTPKANRPRKSYKKGLGNLGDW